MQSLAPLTISDLLAIAKEPLLKIEIYPPDVSPPFAAYDTYGSKKYGEGVYGGVWIGVASLSGIDSDCLEMLSLSFAGSSVTPEPIAATWSLLIANKDALFHSAHPTSGYIDLFTMGKKIRLYMGIKVGSVDYYWLRMPGIMSKPRIEGKVLDVNVSGFDYTQLLTDTKLKSPDNYWGSTSTFSTKADQYRYKMPLNCKGVYIAYWNGAEIYNGNDWTYDSDINEFVLNPDKTINDGNDNLMVYYFIPQIPEEVVADLLVAAGRYPDRTTALNKMEYTATGITIDRVKFNSGNSVLHSISLLCERCNYRFYFKYDGTPIFKPKATAKADGAEDLMLLPGQFTDYRQYEDGSEVFNHITIEGEEQASPIWEQRAEPNKLRGSSKDQDSIDEMGEKTMTINNHLFQDQPTIDAMCATLLAEFKTPKKYISFDLGFSPVPLEIWDTVKIFKRLTSESGICGKYNAFKYGDGTKYGEDGIVIAQRGLDRDIKVNRFNTTVILEKVI